MAWSAAQYTKFEDERNRPVRDLLAQVPNLSAGEAADIGCGPGNSTAILGERFPGAVLLGIDSSPEMIEAARRRLPGIRFEVDDIADWRSAGGPFDVILANAALQWVPDHAAVLPSLLARLAPGGSLAVQIPHNLREPAHTLMREIAAGGAWAGRLEHAGRVRDTEHDARWYYRMLRDCGVRVNVWRTTYHHPLSGAAAVVEWFKGSALRPFLEPLDPREQAEFLERYEAAIERAYPAFLDGTVLLPFPRLFFVATRGAA